MSKETIIPDLKHELEGQALHTSVIIEASKKKVEVSTKTIEMTNQGVRNATYMPTYMQTQPLWKVSLRNLTSRPPIEHHEFDPIGYYLRDTYIDDQPCIVGNIARIINNSVE